MIIKAVRPANVPENAVPNIFWMTEGHSYFPSGSPAPSLNPSYDKPRGLVRPQPTFDFGHGIALTEDEARHLASGVPFNSESLIDVAEALRQFA